MSGVLTARESAARRLAFGLPFDSPDASAARRALLRQLGADLGQLGASEQAPSRLGPGHPAAFNQP